MIMGLWDRNPFLRYIRIQVSDRIKVINTLTTNKQELYTILEADIVYHTPGKYDTEPHRLNLHRRGR